VLDLGKGVEHLPLRIVTEEKIHDR
jgi:hypothetical protein